MFLKKVEIQGFKTFANSTIIEFTTPKGITAIVGPNGCGKSNLLDAMRWVTGEQSIKLLRGTSHEEIIFAGSEEKKPLSMAEVALTIDNSDGKLPIDYSEIVVKRRLYRSGESEYYINKERCRLKDIHDMLMDTGLGKGSYSMISQGQVAEILHSKPEDRRTIFEEAAGINKYKNRKISAQRKLQNTDQNLLRMKDIRSEIHQQLGPLEEQAKKAEEYKKYKEELGGLEVGLYKEKVDRLLKEKQEIVTRIDEFRSKLSEADVQVAEAERKKEDFRQRTLQLETLIQEKQENIESLRRQKEEISSAFQVNQERLMNQEARLQQLSEETQKLLVTKGVLDQKKIESETDLKAAQQYYEKVEKELDLKAKETEVILQRWEMLTREKEDLQMSLFDMENEVMSVKNQLMDLQSKEKFTAEELRRSENAIAKIKKEKDDLAQQEKEVVERKLQITQKIALLKTEKEQLIASISATGAAIEKNDHTYESLKERLDTKNSRLELLQEMQKNYEGFFEGVKNFLAHKDENGFEGIHGVVADIIKPQQRYEVALEVALGNRLQDIIVESKKVADKSIAFLKEKNLGRATFISLENVFGHVAAAVPQGHCALSLVAYDKKYAEVVKYLLGRIVVVEDLEAAFKMQAALRGTYEVSRIVTLNGDIVTPQGAFTGGAVKHKTSLLGRQREIIELNHVVETLRVQIEEVRQEKTALEEQLKANQRALEIKIEDIQHNEIENKTLLNDKTRIDLEIEKKNDEVQGIEASFSMLKEDFNTLKHTQSEKEAELGRQTNDKESITASVSNKESEIKAATEEKETAHHILTELKIAAASAKAQVNQTEARFNSVVDNLNLHEKQIQEKTAEAAQLQQNKIETARSLSEAQEKLPAYEVQENSLNAAIGEHRLEKTRLANDIDVIERKSKEANELDREWRDKVAQEEVAVARLDAELNKIEERLTTEYELTLADVIKADVSQIEDYEKVYQHVEKLKRTIKRLEPVNLLAIEEFRAQKERLAFIEAQCTDLEDAKKNLHALIKELDGLAVKNFENTFLVVKKYFEDIFKKLFEGGKAELSLIDNSNVLESGIEIFAQPPGKKRQNLTLLSGGEKALTAIALLFALLKTRPSPFCVMDEVDAALDEVNIGRFSRLLKAYAEEARIMVITHSKRTMAIASSIYGVTMERNGVSRLLSMKMVKEEESVPA